MVPPSAVVGTVHDRDGVVLPIWGTLNHTRTTTSRRRWTVLGIRRRLDEIFRFISCWRRTRFCFWRQSFRPTTHHGSPGGSHVEHVGLAQLPDCADLRPADRRAKLPGLREIFMLMAIAAATCAMVADFLFLIWKLTNDTRVHKNIAEGVTIASTRRGHINKLAVGSCG